MKAQRKAKVEQRAVLALLAIFAVVFVTRSGRSLGLFRSSVRRWSAQSSGSTSTMKPLSTLIQQYNDQIDNQSEPKRTVASASAPVANVAYTAQTLRDPLRSLLPPPAQKEPKPIGHQGEGPEGMAMPPSAKPAAPPDLKLQGLLWGGQEPKAIIGDRLYGVGELVQGAKILTIDRTGVTVDYQGTSIVYTMPVKPDARGSGSAGWQGQWR